MLKLDHFAVSCQTLQQGADFVSQRLGVPMQPGGQHIRFGTHNLLLNLGDLYLEVIGIDPDAPPIEGPPWFDLANFSGPPKLTNWICQTDEITAIAAAHPMVGDIIPLTRGDLAWQITVPQDGGLPMKGAFPTLLTWAPGTKHPSARLSDRGCRLTSFTVHHPDAQMLAQTIKLDDPRVHFLTGAMQLSAQFDTPNGPRTL